MALPSDAVQNLSGALRSRKEPLCDSRVVGLGVLLPHLSSQPWGSHGLCGVQMWLGQVLGLAAGATNLRHPPPSKNWHLMRAQGTLCSACVGLACVQPCTPSRAVLVPLWALSCSWSLAWQSCVWVVKASVPCRTGGGELCDVEEDTCQRS